MSRDLAATKKRWYGPIETPEDAIAVVREMAKGYFFLAGLEAILSPFIGLLALVDAGLLAILAFILIKLRSRVAAVALLVVSLLEGYQTFANRFAGERYGGTNIFLAVIMIWAGIRSVRATFKYWKLQHGSSMSIRPV